MEQLPSELIGKIIEQFDQQDVLAIMKTSKKLYALAKWRLYARVVFNCKYTCCPVREGQTIVTEMESIIQLLQGDNAKMIQHFRFEGTLYGILEPFGQFRTFFEVFKKFLFEDNRLVSFVDVSSFSDYEVERNQEIRAFQDSMPDILFEDGRFPNLVKVIISRKKGVRDLSSRDERCYYYAEKTKKINTRRQWYHDLRGRGYFKVFVGFVLDTDLLNLLIKKGVTFSADNVRLDLRNYPSITAKSLSQVLDLYRIKNLEVLCCNENEQKKITNALDRYKSAAEARLRMYR